MRTLSSLILASGVIIQKNNNMNLEDLEKEKVQLEIDELKRHWLKNPHYLQVLLPTILAIFSLLYAITSGLFSSKQELLELNKRQLETDITKFQTEKTSLIGTNNQLKTQIGFYNDSLENKNLILKKYEASFTKERKKIQSLNSEVEILRKTKDDYNQQIKQLEKDFNSKKQRYLKEIESKYYQEIDLQKKDQDRNTVIEDYKSQISELKYEVDILKSSPYLIKDKKNEFDVWFLDKKIEYHKLQAEKAHNNALRLQKNVERLKKKSDTSMVKYKITKIE